MATGIGSAIAFLAKHTNYRFLSVATGFSGGGADNLRWFKECRDMLSIC
ncbi:MAG: hypothetical protein JXR25_05685 [Pontiellaceae bacterium]|nr:hypothetical protein [Pontiellaceae bacterium]MBN2784298.1 hypothetical protein [Pontiellaceae bacterium]